MSQILQILKENNKTIKDNIINLGWENGWDKKDSQLWRKLWEFNVPGTYFSSGKYSWKKYEVTLDDKSGNTYILKWEVDSGD